MKSILIIAPTLPWPPTTGGDILRVNFATALHRDYHLHLLCYYGAGQSPATIDPLRPYFKTIEVLTGSRETFLADPGAPPAINIHYAPAMAAACARKLAELQPDLILFEFWFMGQYLEHVPAARKFPTAIFAIDIEHVRRRRMSPETNDAPWEKYRDYELRYYRLADRILTVTETDRQVLLREGFDPARVTVSPIGFQVDYDPTVDQEEAIVFVGAFDHAPNEDGVRWFAAAVWPELRRRFPRLTFSIVGRVPPPGIRALHHPEAGVIVTGTVPRVAPFLNRARVAVAPLRFGSGIKAKICEALGYALPVVTTPIGGGGLEGAPGIVIAADAAGFAASITELLDDEPRRRVLGAAGRAWFETHCSLDALRRNLATLYRDLIP